MADNFNVDELSWEPHPFSKGVLIKKLLSKNEDAVNLSILMVKVKKGLQIPAHVHETQDDMCYHLKGKCKMWVEGVGDLEMRAGDFIRIPAGVKHQPHDIEEDILVLDIFFGKEQVQWSQAEAE
jgi:quercetin dioxygenase-like cupin family protein